MMTIVTVAPCVLDDSAGEVNYVVFEASGVPDPTAIFAILGGGDCEDFEVGPTVATSLPNWYATQITGLVNSEDGRGRGEMPYLSFDVGITITITCEDLTSNTFAVPAVLFDV